MDHAAQPTRRLTAAGAAVGILGAVLVGLSFAFAGPASLPLLLIGLVALVAGGLVSILSELPRLRRRWRPADLDKYACPRCNYTPSMSELRHGEGQACPKCGQIIYKG